MSHIKCITCNKLIVASIELFDGGHESLVPVVDGLKLVVDIVD